MSFAAAKALRAKTADLELWLPTGELVSASMPAERMGTMTDTLSLLGRAIANHLRDKPQVDDYITIKHTGAPNVGRPATEED